MPPAEQTEGTSQLTYNNLSHSIYLHQVQILYVRNVPHLLIIVHCNFECTLVAFYIYRISIVEAIAAILVSAALALVGDGELHCVVLVAHRVIVPFVPVGEQRFTHQRQNGLWSVLTSQ